MGLGAVMGKYAEILLVPAPLFSRGYDLMIKIRLIISR
jgi:hypothetical protein